MHQRLLLCHLLPLLINPDGHPCEGYVYLLVLDFSKCRRAFHISYCMPTLGETMDKWTNEAAAGRKAECLRQSGCRKRRVMAESRITHCGAFIAFEMDCV